ncbi:MAG TPA: hypothetical protein VHV47_05135 [Opitutaceae bacterium]|nr:hypothetical protein [Opitutaceae bacterium]
METFDTRKRLTTARERLEAKDLTGAVAIYAEMLSAGEPRPDVLLTISGDLGSTGHMRPIVELVAPRYDAQRHGPAIGLNVLQAYLALRNTEAAQHVLDMLFSLNRPELEERLYGFSNAIVEMATENASLGSTDFLHQESLPPEAIAEGGEAPLQGTRISLASISRPIWSYGLEPLLERILPPKGESLRRVAFAQLAQLGSRDIARALAQPEDEMARLARALPLWLTETFYFSPHYSPVTALGYLEKPDGTRQPMIFDTEWGPDNLRQIVESTKDGLDYIFTGTLRHHAGDYEAAIRVWEVKKFRQRKQFDARWTPATAEAELGQLHAQIRQFMEWAPYPEGSGVPYVAPPVPSAWIEALGASLGYFLVEKNLQPIELLRPGGPALAALAACAADSAAASLAWLSAVARARDLGQAPDPLPTPALVSDPLVAAAREMLAL